MKKLLWKTLCISLAVVLLTGNVCLAALTKTETTQSLEWVELAAAEDATGIKETGTIDVSDCYSAVLHIDCCLSSTTAHEGTEIIVQIASEAGVDDAWTTLTRFIGPIGTASKADFGDSEAAAQTVLSVTNPDTANLNHNGKFIFLEDTGAVAGCEIAYQIADSGDAGDTITVIDGITSAKDTDDDVYTVDGSHESAVGTYAVEIPMSASQARVIFNNWYDDDGTASTVHVRVRVTKVTGL
ncbi:MAG: hypothetical protein PVJ60_09825 [Phycisphaerales bacterium]|jgi:hypothetical protein